MKIIKYTITLLFINVLALLITANTYASSLKNSPVMIKQTIDTKESDKQVLNPDRGFYSVLAVYETGKDYEFTDKYIEDNCSYIIKSCTENGINLVNIKIHIKSGADNKYTITDSDISNINKYFAYAEKNNLKVIPRAAYIWDSPSSDKEPEDISLVYKNIDTLCNDIYNPNSHNITVVQTGIFGPWGEMHSSNLLDQYLEPVIKRYLDNLYPYIQISVRRPSYYRQIFDTDEPIKSYTSHTGADISRVGIYNDGYLATESDYGTYTDWTRNQELEFQDYHNRYTVFGGEVSICDEIKEPYGSDQELAISDMQKIHCTYLNSEWNESLYNNWTGFYKDNQTGLEYIKNHLGYRLVLREAYISDKLSAKDSLDIKLSIENTGFANIVNNDIVKIILKSDDNIYTFDTDEDPRYWESGKTSEADISIASLGDIKEDNYDVYLKIPDRSENEYLSIRFANETGFNEEIHANYIGSVQITNNTNNDFEDNNDDKTTSSPSIDSTKTPESDGESDKDFSESFDSFNVLSFICIFSISVFMMRVASYGR